MDLWTMLREACMAWLEMCSEQPLPPGETSYNAVVDLSQPRPARVTVMSREVYEVSGRVAVTERVQRTLGDYVMWLLAIPPDRCLATVSAPGHAATLRCVGGRCTGSFSWRSGGIAMDEQIPPDQREAVSKLGIAASNYRVVLPALSALLRRAVVRALSLLL